jgi:mono/diheme cytochrome c family protein
LKLGDTPRDAEQFAKQMTTPNQPIAIPPEPPLTPAGLEEGRDLYVKSCANCHVQNGEGKRDPTWRTSEGYPTWSRNLREGVFKGGREPNGLYLRFHTGLPGTPMPSLEIPGEKVWRIVQYVLSLSDPSAQEKATIKPVELVAKRVSRLPTGPEDPIWDTLPETRVPLMPLWWIKGYIAEAFVKVAHDGQRVAFRLQWKDATRDVGGVQIKSFSDVAAVQFAAGANPPLFAMGAAGDVVNIWHWKALWDEDRKAFQDVGQAFPNMVSYEYLGGQKGWGAPPLEGGSFLPARELANAVARPRTTSVEEATAAGFGTYTAQAPKDQNVVGASSWKDGVWRVAFVRDLKSTSGDEIALIPGGSVSVAFAVWNGSANERNGQKTVSIWNTLKLE